MDAQTAVPLLHDRFEAITGLAVDDWECDRRRVGGLVGADARLSTGGKQFMVEYRPAATTEQLSAALRRLSTRKSGARSPIPLLVVPYMGPTGQQLCRSEGISWLDLSGNADISAPPIRIRILGQPNQFKRPGRPASLFSPGSSRLARTLLLNPVRTYTLAGLAQSTGLSPGFLSRLLPRYEESGFVSRTTIGRMIQFSSIDPDGLLDAWRAAYPLVSLSGTTAPLTMLGRPAPPTSFTASAVKRRERM